MKTDNWTVGSIGVAWRGGNDPTRSWRAAAKWRESGALAELGSAWVWGPAAAVVSWRRDAKRMLFFELAW